MSALQKSAASFKASLAGAADKLPSRPLPPRPTSIPTPPSSSPPSSQNAKRKRPAPPAPPVVYSQPTDKALMGQHILTQVHHAVTYLKEKEKPYTPAELASYLSVEMTPTLLDILKNNERVHWDPAAGTLEFKPKHNIRSETALLQYLQSQTTAQGLVVKELKDGWAGAIEAIDNLEASRDILVTRTKKDNQARMVWGNDKTLDVVVEDEFKEIWHKIEIPPNEELPGVLERLGLKPTSMDPAKMKKEVKREAKGRKRANNRRSKISNTHMSGILLDSKDLRK